jgi:hypothetical protein
VSVPLWVSELARIFWTRARHAESFPRNLRRPIARGFQFSVVMLPELTVSVAMKWLMQCGIVCELPGQSRLLRACLVARWGHGIAILDGDQSEDELRFTLAHELAHFLKDYWFLRTEVQRRLGAGALEVMDGQRPPTSDERLHALLSGIPLGFHVHLMERDKDGTIRSAIIAESEENADRLAYELLAPADHIFAGGVPKSDRVLVEKLRCFYGLPGLQASRYARMLVPSVHTDPLILRLKSLANV